MDYLFRYSIREAPEARIDGSKQVAHQMWIVTLVDDGTSYTKEDWRGAPQAPEHHKTVLIPGDELQAALSTGTMAQKGAAYKNLIRDHHRDSPEPLDTGWVLENMEAFMDNNDIAAEAATTADEFIRTVDTGAYPISFTL